MTVLFNKSWSLHIETKKEKRPYIEVLDFKEKQLGKIFHSSSDAVSGRKQTARISSLSVYDMISFCRASSRTPMIRNAL